MLRCLLLIAAVCACAVPHAQTDAARPFERALAAGDSGRAYTEIRRALGDAPDDAGLHRAKLELELARVGMRLLPRFARHQRIVATARRLREVAPADTLALSVLVDDALWDVLSTHDLVTPTATQSGISGAAFVSREEIEARLGRSRFDVDARRRLADDLDASGPARAARRRLPDLLTAWHASAPGSLRPWTAALTLALVDADTNAVLAAARGARAARPDRPEAALYAGLAQHLAGDDAASAASFAEAFDALGPESRARYESPEALLTPDEQAAFSTAPDSVAAAYWDAHDPRRLTGANERRTEHAARVVEADLLFGRSLADLFRPLPEPPRGAETAQGRLWVRYGRPARTTRFSPNDDGVQAYGDTRFAVWDYDGFRFVFDDPDRDGAYRTYSPPASAFQSVRAADDDYVLQDRRMQREAPSQTAVVPDVDVPLLATRFRRADGTTEVVVAYGLPVTSGTDRLAAGVFSLRGGRVVASETARIDRLPLALAGGGPAVWPLAATVPLADAGASVRAEVGAGTAWGGATVALDALPATGFGVSDLLLAVALDPDGGGPVVRGGTGLTPAPRAVFQAGDPVYVAVEAYALALVAGRTDVDVEAALTPLDARRGLGRLFGRRRAGGVSVAFRTQGEASTETFAFAVETAGQRAGRYTLALTITDRATGATATAQREVTLE